MADILQRLRATLTDKDNMPRMSSEKWLAVGLAKEAADEIERLRSALAPFAEAARRFAPYPNLQNDACVDVPALTLGHLRAAAAALNIHQCEPRDG